MKKGLRKEGFSNSSLRDTVVRFFLESEDQSHYLIYFTQILSNRTKLRSELGSHVNKSFVRKYLVSECSTNEILILVALL